MVEWWQAILLGLVQGLTEFIPVSSSAHLNITRWLLGHDERQFAFDMMLNLGTLAALMFYFWHDWVELLRNPEQKHLRNLVFAACVPAVIAGLLVHDLEKESPYFAEPRFNAVMLIVMGLVLWLADHTGRKRRVLEQANWKDAITVGCSQALALVPGVSRSGATITAGLFRRLTREAAARFSFLMSLPITLGATLFEARKLFEPGGIASLNATVPVMLLGIIVSGVSGFWAIGFLLNYLKTRSVTLFVVWRILVAILVFGLCFLRGELFTPPKTPPPSEKTAMVAPIIPLKH